MRITCVIGTLGSGGAERVMTHLCAGLSSRGHQVTLLTLDSSVPDFYTLSPAVSRRRLELPSFKKAGVFGGIPRLWELTRALKDTHPEVVISFMTISVLASCLFLRIPYIYADHLDVRYLSYSRKWKLLRNGLLRFAKTVTVLSERDRQYIISHHPHWKPTVVYNPALPCPASTGPVPACMLPDKKYVLAVGRLVKQKGFDRLLNAWHRICNLQEGWQLLIIGSGPEEQALKRQARRLGISNRVDFVTPQKDLTGIYKRAELLAMSSRAEGFPMVLLEAMAAGVPAVSFACTGPDVIIRNGIDGRLVEQNHIDSFARQLAELMQNETKRRLLGKRAREVTSRFSLAKYIDTYEKLCLQALK